MADAEENNKNQEELEEILILLTAQSNKAMEGSIDVERAKTLRIHNVLKSFLTTQQSKIIIFEKQLKKYEPEA